MLNGIANGLGVAATIFFTYYFTMIFSKKPPVPEPVPEAVRVAEKKVEELHAGERKLLTTYGVVNPALNTVRIPVERAMELIAAESARPPAASTPSPVVTASTVAAAVPGGVGVVPKVEPTSTTPKPVVVAATASPVSTTATTTATTTKPAPAPPPAPVGLAPAVLYRAICIACHDVDGRGGIVRKAMPVIPDFTDPKWQLTRTDAELQHSILEGKGQLMLPMKDKFALAKTDPKAMIAFIRQFQPGAPVVAAPSAVVSTTPATKPAAGVTPSSIPVPASPATTVAATPTPAATAPSTPHSAVATPTASPATPGSSSAALAMSSPLPPEALALLSPPPTSAVTPTSPTAPKGVARSAETVEKLRVSGELYRTNCTVCHGPDGRGVSAVRVAMPTLPDFTGRAWQSSHETVQLSISILDGKGTLMPPWRSKVSSEQARDLVAYVRNFGPADLVTEEIPPSEFGNRYRKLKMQWDELDRQSRTLSRP